MALIVDNGCLARNDDAVDSGSLLEGRSAIPLCLSEDLRCAWQSLRYHIHTTRKAYRLIKSKPGDAHHVQTGSLHLLAVD